MDVVTDFSKQAQKAGYFIGGNSSTNTENNVERAVLISHNFSRKRDGI
jgi:hypothetical protein